jgi:hypothetical protein
MRTTMLQNSEFLKKNLTTFTEFISAYSFLISAFRSLHIQGGSSVRKEECKTS